MSIRGVLFNHTIGHAAPGVFFTLFGFWWSLNIIYLLIQRNKERRQYLLTKTWFPSSLLFRCKSSRPIEPCIKIVLAIVGATVELSSGYWTLYSHDDFEEANIGNFSHATMFAFFGLTGIVEIVTELRTFKAALPLSLSHLTISMAFGVEGILFFFHLDDGRSLLDTKTHVILYMTIFSCTAAVALEGWLKPCPGATMARAYLTTLQGTWFLQIAYALYGSNRWNENNRASDMLIPIVFAWHILGIFLLFFVIYLSVQYMNAIENKMSAGFTERKGQFADESSETGRLLTMDTSS